MNGLENEDKPIFRVELLVSGSVGGGVFGIVTLKNWRKMESFLLTISLSSFIKFQFVRCILTKGHFPHMILYIYIWI